LRSPIRGLLLFASSIALVVSASLAQTNLTEIHKNLKMVAVAVADGAIKLDGDLSEPEWKLAEPATDFIQRLPNTGKPATERTEVRILYDQHNIYVGVDCFDSAGDQGITIKDIRPDFYTLDSDGFQVVFDTFDDDRNCFLFGINPAGARFDMQIGSDGTASNTAWNGIWYVKTRIDSDGWHAEIGIPLTTLRFNKTEEQVWGVNFERRVRRKSEDSYWAPLPAAFRLGRISLAGTLLGLKGIKQGRNLYVKPYVTAPFSRKPNGGTRFKPDAGLDVKYGVGSQLTLDLTANTDFSQVEADEEQINLTRYNLFFPEKRDFFLENASLFKVGRSRPFVSQPRPDFVPFFTRRIGISNDGRLIPILGGARLTGRAGKYTMGMLSMETDAIEGNPRTNYSVIRMRRDILGKSDVGGFFTSKLDEDGGYNRTYGGDINLNFFKNLDVSSYVFRTDSPGVHDKNWASYFEVGWKDDLLDLSARRLAVDENFDPQMGYVSRTAMRKNAGDFELTFRPREKTPWIRYLGPAVLVEYITDPENSPESKSINAYFDMVLKNGSQLQAGRISSFERLEKPFKIHLDQTVAPGDYRFDDYYVSFVTDRNHLLGGSVRIDSGGFYDGSRRSYALSGDLRPGYRFTAGLTWNHNDVHLSGGDFSTNLIGARLGFAFSTRHFFNALIQYNSDTRDVSSNLRLNLFHAATNDLYLVYNERRSSTGTILDRAIICKLTHIFSF
jgi:hypothetical protein